MWNENNDKFIALNNKYTMDDFIHHIWNPREDVESWTTRICRILELNTED